MPSLLCMLQRAKPFGPFDGEGPLCLPSWRGAGEPQTQLSVPSLTGEGVLHTQGLLVNRKNIAPKLPRQGLGYQPGTGEEARGWKGRHGWQGSPTGTL